MLYVCQRTGAKTGESGDCFSACIASVMDLGLAAIPNFNHATENGQLVTPTSTRKLRKWLASYGYTYAEFGFKLMTLAELLTNMGETMPDTTYLLIGRTYTYRVHCVVAKGGLIVHDPAAKAGEHSLSGPCPDGYWRVGLFLWDR